MALADIIVSPAKSYFAPLGEVNPDPDAIPYDTPWGGNWNYLGSTTEALNLASSVETFEVDIQQSTIPVKQSITGQEITVQTSLAEFTVENMQLLFGGTITNTPAGSGTVGYDELKAGARSVPDTYKWGFEGVYVDALNNRLPIRMFFHIGSIIQNGDIAFDKAGVAAIPVQITVLTDTTQAAGEELFLLQIVKEVALA